MRIDSTGKIGWVKASVGRYLDRLYVKQYNKDLSINQQLADALGVLVSHMLLLGQFCNED